MKKVLHKIKSQWLVLGVMGTTVISLGNNECTACISNRSHSKLLNNQQMKGCLMNRLLFKGRNWCRRASLHYRGNNRRRSKRHYSSDY